MDARLEDCATRDGRLAALILLKFHVFPSAENDTFFHNEKPGAISARAFCTALDTSPLYTYHVTLVYERGVVTNEEL